MSLCGDPAKRYKFLGQTRGTGNARKQQVEKKKSDQMQSKKLTRSDKLVICRATEVAVRSRNKNKFYWQLHKYNKHVSENKSRAFKSWNFLRKLSEKKLINNILYSF